jgi:transposase
VKTIDTEGLDNELAVILGVDTHLHFHVAVAVDNLGRRLGEASVPTTAKGYEELLRWAEGLGSIRCAGVEGTSSYGAGFARHLRDKGIEVLEVERPKHRRRNSHRNLQKSDSSDAEAAARAVLAGEASGVPKSADGKVVRHRLNRGGNREANRALYMICLARMRRDPRTQEYVERRTQEGKSKREIIRCLKRYIAREVYRVLVSRGIHASPTGPREEAYSSVA